MRRRWDTHALSCNVEERNVKKIALEEHFTRPELSAYSHRPQSSLNSPILRKFEARPRSDRGSYSA